MAKVRVTFEDFVEMLYDCEYGYHFESVAAEDGELLLRLFVDGTPRSWEMSVRSGRVEVATEIVL